MSIVYDKYYQTEELFGKPYPELIDFFSNSSNKGKLLDLGCGQGRDAIPLARLGFEVMGIDSSKVGIDQMNQIALKEKLLLEGVVADIFKFDTFNQYDFVLMDSMFHFEKKDKKRETDFIKRIVKEVKNGALIIFCIQDTGEKVNVLNESIDFSQSLERTVEKKFQYIFEDAESGHKSITNYQMIVVRK